MSSGVIRPLPRNERTHYLSRYRTYPITLMTMSMNVLHRRGTAEMCEEHQKSLWIYSYCPEVVSHGCETDVGLPESGLQRKDGAMLIGAFGTSRMWKGRRNHAISRNEITNTRIWIHEVQVQSWIPATWHQRGGWCLWVEVKAEFDSVQREGSYLITPETSDHAFGGNFELFKILFNFILPPIQYCLCIIPSDTDSTT